MRDVASVNLLEKVVKDKFLALTSSHYIVPRLYGTKWKHTDRGFVMDSTDSIVTPLIGKSRIGL